MTNKISSNPAVGPTTFRCDWSVPFQNVLVGVDGTAGGRSAIALADLLCDFGGRLTLAHVSPGQVPVHRRVPPRWADERCRVLLEQERDATGVSARLAGVYAPSVGRGLHRLAEDRQADLVVVGSCRRGHLGRELVGDDARHTVSHAPCAVAVAPHGYGEQPHLINRVGVAYDDSDESRAALALARSLAAREGCSVTAVTVVNPVSITLGGWGGLAPAWSNLTDTLVEGANERLRALDGLDERRVAVGDIGAELVAFGDEVDLLVVGSRARGPVRRVMLGSTSLQLTHTARCPLLVVPRATQTGLPHASPFTATSEREEGTRWRT
jgi:nucleotide-binding universal stress UspA family protein